MRSIRLVSVGFVGTFLLLEQLAQPAGPKVNFVQHVCAETIGI